MLMRDFLVAVRVWCFRKILRMDLHPDVRVSLKAHLDFTYPQGIHIGEGTYVALYAVILAHDMSRALQADTRIGRNCFIGAHSIVMPGVSIGDECIVASGSVVTKDIPSHSMVAGNPAAVIRSGIRTVKWGILEEAYNNALVANSGIDANLPANGAGFQQ